jgi:hypothetical protein
MTPRTWAYGETEREDLPIRDRSYERYGQQGFAMATYVPEPYRPEDDDAFHGHDAARLDLGEPLPTPSVGPRGWRPSDERIHDEVCTRLTDDGYVDASDVEIVVHDGEVTLMGSVDDRDQRRRVEWIADSVRGVVDVMNRIRVRPAEASSDGPPRR